MSEDWTFDDVCSVCFLMPHIADQFRSLMQQSGDVPRYISALQASWAGLQSMRIWSSFSLIPISFLPWHTLTLALCMAAVFQSQGRPSFELWGLCGHRIYTLKCRICTEIFHGKWNRVHSEDLMECNHLAPSFETSPCGKICAHCWGSHPHKT